MAENASNHLEYLLQLELTHQDYLGQIRHWDNLKMAKEVSCIWIKGLTENQIESVELQSIPFAKIYECRDNLLFPKGSLLPSGKNPNVLWTPIERALPIELSNLNHNFFGVQEQYTIRLVQSDLEQKATALLVDLPAADPYINTAAAIRLQHIQWTLINNEKALFLGTPFLPLNGTSYWQTGDFILPVGFDFEFPILANSIQNKISTTDYIWWIAEDNYTSIPKEKMQALSIAAWRQTVKI